ncbi:TPA: hypothetical protein ACX6PR_002586 [Photobacterium damselae]|uniref:hypothetical protein n=1 Tax=Photobacterium damselae TaxID=38293 RepID=UPI00406792F2
MEIIISLIIGVVTGWFSNFFWSKWQDRRKDTYLTIEADGTGLKLSGRFNVEVTDNDADTKNILKAVNNAVNKV